MSKDAVERLKTWVRAGGTLVTMGGATEWAADEDVALTSARKVADAEPKPATPPATATTPAAPARPGTAGRRAGSIAADRLAEELVPYQSSSASANTPESVPGIHVDVLLDRTHWLTAGYDAPRLTVLLQGDSFSEPSKEGANVAVFPATGPLVRAGFTWPNNTERLLRGTSLLIDEPIGGGHVVLFTNEPMFRGWWRSLDRLVLNALTAGSGVLIGGEAEMRGSDSADDGLGGQFPPEGRSSSFPAPRFPSPHQIVVAPQSSFTRTSGIFSISRGSSPLMRSSSGRI